MIKICGISGKYRHCAKIEEIKYGEIYKEDIGTSSIMT